MVKEAIDGAPRRPVAGWEGNADRLVLRVGAMRAVVVGTSTPWWQVSRHLDHGHYQGAHSVVDSGDAPTTEDAQLAAEDAIRAVLARDAAALGLRVVPL